MIGGIMIAATTRATAGPSGSLAAARSHINPILRKQMDQFRPIIKEMRLD